MKYPTLRVEGAEAESFYSLYRLPLPFLRPVKCSNGLNRFEECTQLGRRLELLDRIELPERGSERVRETPVVAKRIRARLG